MAENVNATRSRVAFAKNPCSGAGTTVTRTEDEAKQGFATCPTCGRVVKTRSNELEVKIQPHNTGGPNANEPKAPKQGRRPRAPKAPKAPAEPLSVVTPTVEPVEVDLGSDLSSEPVQAEPTQVEIEDKAPEVPEVQDEKKDEDELDIDGLDLDL